MASVSSDVRSPLSWLTVHSRRTTAPPLQADVFIAEARWLGMVASLIDLLFGYGPAYMGFGLALLACNPDAQEFAVIVDRGAALLATVVGYLIMARFLLTLWRPWRAMSTRVSLVKDHPHERGEADRLWSWGFEFEGLMTPGPSAGPWKQP
jgi:hypothetical protein